MRLEKAQSIQSFLKLYLDRSVSIASQQVDELHGACVRWNGFGMGNFIIDDPLGRVLKVIHDEDVTSFHSGVADMPSIEDEPAMDTICSELRRESNGVIHAFSLPAFALE
jgi:hypothetical protein